MGCDGVHACVEQGKGRKKAAANGGGPLVGKGQVRARLFAGADGEEDDEDDDEDEDEDEEEDDEEQEAVS